MDRGPVSRHIGHSLAEKQENYLTKLQPIAITKIENIENEKREMGLTGNEIENTAKNIEQKISILPQILTTSQDFFQEVKAEPIFTES